MTEQSKFKKFIQKNLPVIAAFVIPFIVILIIYIASEVYPFGDDMYMRSDSYHQYLPFMRAFQRAIQEGRPLSYMWEIGLGSNFASTYAYYLASPINWVVALFPSTAVSAVMDFFIAFKCGLMGATFCYFVTKKFGKRTYKATAIAIFYALSSYMAAFSWNLMWLDCLVLLPLVMLGLERLVKEKKVVLYTITLGLAVLSNYYIGIMVSIFMVIYFIYLIICEGGNKDGTKRSAIDIIKGIVRFGWFSILAGLMSMVVVLPAIFALSGTASASSTFPKTLTLYNEILELFSKGTTLTDPALFSGYFPNMYCTAAAFILIPLFWLNRRISLKKRIGLTLLIAFFLFSFNSNVMTYIWHGFHFPNGLPCRESFLLIAVVLLVCYEVLLHIRYYSKLELIIVTGWGIIANVIFYLLYKDKNFTLLTGCVTAGFILLYFVVFFLMNNRKLAEKWLIIMLLAVCIGDAAFNTAYTGYGTAGYDYYTADNEAITSLLDSVDDGSFYRVEKVSRRTKNDGTWLDYKSASIFNSTSLDGVTKFYEKFGMQSSMNAISYYGHTPLVTMILGVQYEIAKEEQNDSLMTFVGQAAYNEGADYVYLYENKYVLELGYQVNTNSQYEMELSSNDPFKSQNEFAEATCGVEDLIIDNGSISGTSAGGVFKANGRGLIYVTNKVDEVQVLVKRADMTILDKKFTDLENSQILDLGDVEEGDTVLVECADSEHSGTSLTVLMGVMDYDKLEQVYERLSKNQLQISEYDEGYVKGTVTIEEGKQLLTSIPCDEGWKIYVDGKEAVLVSEATESTGTPTYSKYLDAFLSVQMEPGEHVIEFKFVVPGQGLGIALAILGLLLFIFSVLMLKNSRTKPRLKKNDEHYGSFDEADGDRLLSVSEENPAEIEITEKPVESYSGKQIAKPDTVENLTEPGVEKNLINENSENNCRNSNSQELISDDSKEFSEENTEQTELENSEIKEEIIPEQNRKANKIKKIKVR